MTATTCLDTTCAGGQARMSWPALLLLLAAFYLAEPWDVTFSASEIANVLTNDLTAEDRVDSNIESRETGSRGRQIGLVLLAGFGLWCLRWSDPRRWRPQGGLALLVLLFFAWTLLSIGWSDDPLKTLKKVGVLGFLALGALGVAVRFSHEAILRFVVDAVLVLSVLGVGAELALGTFRPWAAVYRFSGMNWPAFSAWCLSLLILAALALRQRDGRRRGVPEVLILIVFAFLLLTKTRAALAGLFVGAALCAFLTSSVATRAFAALSILFCGCLFCFSAELAGSDLMDRAFTVVNLGREESASGLSGRSELWWDLTPYIFQRPLLGYGYESFWTADRLYEIGRSHWGAPDAHNGFINMTLGVGLIGTALYTLVLVAAFLRCLALYRLTHDRFFAFAAASLVALCFNAMFVSTQLAPALYSFISLVVIFRLAFVEVRRPVADLQPQSVT